MDRSTRWLKSLRLVFVLIVTLTLGASVPSKHGATTTDISKSDGTYTVPDPSGPEPLPSRRTRVDSAYTLTRGAAEPIIPGDGLNVIYGTDDRVDMYAVSDAAALHVGQATCLIVDEGELTNNGNGTYTLSTSPWLTQAGVNVCSDEPFRGQLTAGFCTGFLIGADLLATAGHCVSNGDCNGTAFVFGYEQIASGTPPLTTISADDVYFCTGIINRQYSGDFDHSLVQLDRDVVARSPLPIRRTGVVSNTDPLFVVGHPTSLPMKAADNAEVKNANGATAWFQSNLDTYAGNSGSPVWGVNSGLIEGILVRGAPDFITQGGCRRSNVVPNTGNPGPGLQFEEVSKTITFASSVPELHLPAGTVTLDQTAYSCNALAEIEVRDSDLQGDGSIDVLITSSAGDTETVALTETPASSGVFRNSILTGGGGVSTESGVVEVADGDSIRAIYEDADNGTGNPATATDLALIDCQAPVISNVSVPIIGGASATVTFDTDEDASSIVRYGLSCGALNQSAAGAGGITSHLVTLNGLTPLMTYYFSVEATDLGGTTTIADNAGLCYSFTTVDLPDYFTEIFESGDNDLDSLTITLTPDGSADFYSICVEPSSGFPTDPTGGTSVSLTDDDFMQVILTGGAQVPFYGVNRSSYYIGSNGYITFASGDEDFDETLADHFSLPRIALVYDDFHPGQGSGSIRRQQFADRAVVTYQNVSEYNAGNQSSFQVEMYFDGVIVLTYLNIAPADGLAGISEGDGVPSGFEESDLSAYGDCGCADADGDLVCDIVDNCPGTSNPTQEDTDADSVGNACDNCPSVSNPAQTDGDADEIGDSCDNCPAYTNPNQVGCLHHADPIGDSVTNVFDVIAIIDVAFRGAPTIIDAECAHAGVGRTDVNCDGVTNIIDLIEMIEVAFRGATANFCNPCACTPYPTSCP